MTEETKKSLEIMQRVLDGAISKGAFIDSTSVVLAHNALVHLAKEITELTGEG